MNLFAHTDGAARGNPGQAAIAWILYSEAGPMADAAGILGHTTNNAAEYLAVARLLEYARDRQLHGLAVRCDAMLVVKQIEGEYRVRAEDLAPLHEHVKALLELTGSSISWVPRQENRAADRLVNRALDGNWRYRVREAGQ